MPCRCASGSCTGIIRNHCLKNDKKWPGCVQVSAQRKPVVDEVVGGALALYLWQLCIRQVEWWCGGHQGGGGEAAGRGQV